MKKQVAVAVSFSALLTLSAFAPKIFWQENKSNIGRFPASKDESKPEDKKLEEMKVEAAKIKEEIKEKTQAAVQCVKDDQPTALEDEIKKLMADKEAIMKEIEDLKAKKEEPSESKKEVVKVDKKEDFSVMLSQMTSLMISQQEQQQKLMDQMFSMMNMMQMQMQMQMPQQPLHQYPQQNFMSPLTFQASQMDMSAFHQQSSLFGNLGQAVGISYPTQSPAVAYNNPYETLSVQAQTRAPSAQHDPAFIQREMSIQPQFQTQFPVGNPGFDFLSSSSMSEMQRMQF